jgi:hypothetical protein
VLADTANVAQACRAVTITRSTAYEWRAKSPSFSNSWDEAIETATDALEAEARRRGMEGVDEPVFQGGRKVGTIRRYSDRMLEILLKGHRPRVFSERFQVDPGLPVGPELGDQATFDMGRRLAFAIELALRAKERLDKRAQRPALLSAPGAQADEKRREVELNPMGKGL